MVRPVVGSIQSLVTRGYVGNSAGVPTIQLLGCEAAPVPTVIYTAHGASPGVKGAPVPEETLTFSLQALLAARPDQLVVGYLGTAVNAGIIASRLELFLGETPLILDPVIGDFPKGRYVPEEVAGIIKDRLVPLARVLTPNSFEAGYLTGRKVSSWAGITPMVQALLDMGPEYLLITSVLPSAGEGVLHNIAATREKVLIIRTRLIPGYVYGAGDMLNAALAALLALGHPWEQAAPLATSLVTLGVEAGLRQGKDTVDPFPAILHDRYSRPLVPARGQEDYFLKQAGIEVKEL